MDTQSGASGLVQALFNSNWALVAMIAAAFVLKQFGAQWLDIGAEKIKAGLTWLQGRGNELSLLAQTTIDDRFFELLKRAVSNTAHLKAKLAEAVADGKITPDELADLVQAIIADFKANMGVADWRGFALALLGNERAPRELSEPALERKIRANVYSLLDSASAGVATRRLERSLARERTMRSMRNLSPLPEPECPHVSTNVGLPCGPSCSESSVANP